MVLTGENYGNLGGLVLKALKSKNKLGFVNGKISKPDSLFLEFDTWEICNSMVVAHLYTVINKNLHGQVEYARTVNRCGMTWRNDNLRVMPYIVANQEGYSPFSVRRSHCD